MLLQFTVNKNIYVKILNLELSYWADTTQQLNKCKSVMSYYYIYVI